MAQYSLADAKDHITAIMETALAGETVVFVREGTPVLELRRPAVPTARPDMASVLDEVSRLTRDLPSIGPSFVGRIREMRDERGMTDPPWRTRGS